MKKIRHIKSIILLFLIFTLTANANARCKPDVERACVETKGKLKDFGSVLRWAEKDQVLSDPEAYELDQILKYKEDCECYINNGAHANTQSWLKNNETVLKTSLNRYYEFNKKITACGNGQQCREWLGSNLYIRDWYNKRSQEVINVEKYTPREKLGFVDEIVKQSEKCSCYLGVVDKTILIKTANDMQTNLTQLVQKQDEEDKQNALKKIKDDQDRAIKLAAEDKIQKQAQAIANAKQAQATKRSTTKETTDNSFCIKFLDKSIGANAITMKNYSKIQECWSLVGVLTEAETLQNNTYRGLYERGENTEADRLLEDLKYIEKNEKHCATSRLQCSFINKKAIQFMANWKEAINRIVAEMQKVPPSVAKGNNEKPLSVGTPAVAKTDCQAGLDYYKEKGIEVLAHEPLVLKPFPPDYKPIDNHIFTGSIILKGDGIISGKPISYNCTKSGKVTIIGMGDIKIDKNRSMEAMKALAPIFLINSQPFHASENQKGLFNGIGSKLQPDTEWHDVRENNFILRLMTVQADKIGNYFFIIQAGNLGSYSK